MTQEQLEDAIGALIQEAKESGLSVEQCLDAVELQREVLREELED